jgi:hypothetical protein
MAIPNPLSNPPKSWQRKRGSRQAGRMWLLVIFVVLTSMNCAASLIAPFFGSGAPIFRAMLFIAIFWDSLLLCAIWSKHNWARFALAIFLFGFDALLMVYVPEQIARHPALKGEGVQVLFLLAATNALSAAFILSAIDIRWIARPGNAGD